MVLSLELTVKFCWSFLLVQFHFIVVVSSHLLTLNYVLTLQLDFMDDSLGIVLAKIMNLFQDSQFEVRLAAFNFMAMPTIFVQMLHLYYHSRLLPAFVWAHDTEPNSKVKVREMWFCLYIYMKAMSTTKMSPDHDVNRLILILYSFLLGLGISLIVKILNEWVFCGEIAITRGPFIITSSEVHNPSYDIIFNITKLMYHHYFFGLTKLEIAIASCFLIRETIILSLDCHVLLVQFNFSSCLN